MKLINNGMVDLILGTDGTPTNCHKLTRKIRMTSAHGFKIIKILKQKGIIKYVERENLREKTFILTEKGNKIRDLLLEIENVESGK